MSKKGTLVSSSTSRQVQEFVVRVPKNNTKHYSVMRFHKALNVDVGEWTEARMEREDNIKGFKFDDEMPKFGAGSVYGRQQREIARRKKYGFIDKQYNPDEQPWLLRIGGKGGKKYKGLREGGISENASYYVFTQAPNGSFEAFPLEEWYNFTPIERYKTLNAEEAEEEFERRDKVVNYFSIMVRKRLKTEEEVEKEETAGKTKKKNKEFGETSGEFKISDMDDWVKSSEEGESENENGTEKDSNSKSKKKKQASKKKKKKKGGSDDDLSEDSDDGDEEGREVDYMSTSSSEEEQMEDKSKNELKGVEDEDAIRKMEQSDSDEEEEERKEEEEEAKEKDKKEKEKKEDALGESSNSGSESSDSDDFDNDENFQSPMFMQKSGKKKEASASKNSRPNMPTKLSKSVTSSKSESKAVKRKNSDISNSSAPKKNKLPNATRSQSSVPPQRPPAPAPELALDVIPEEAVRKYLMRKPMTTTDLLQKFRSKKTGLPNDQIVNTIAVILKRLDPEKLSIKGKLYLFLPQSS